MELNLNEDGIEVYKALASETRVQILDILANRPATASELAAELNMSKAILSRHLKMLEEVHLIHQSHNYASADSRKKVYSLNVDQIVINFPKRIYLPFRKKVSEVPLGLYSDFDVQPTCGLASADSTIGEFDDPRAFVLNQRINASLLWFSKGFVEYKIPNLLDQNERPEMLELSLELSSEFPGSNNNWPSDITFYINDVEVGTWTCPGNFSDVRGKLTPAWWDSRYSQYGQLIHIRINHEDTGIEAHHVSNVKLEELHLEDSPVIALRIAVRENAEHVGGVTIFGEHFGNNPQNILLSMYYSTADKSVN